MENDVTNLQAMPLEQNIYFNIDIFEGNIFEYMAMPPDAWQVIGDGPSDSDGTFTLEYGENSSHSQSGMVMNQLGVRDIPQLPLQTPGWSDNEKTKEMMAEFGITNYIPVELPTIQGQKITLLQGDFMEETGGIMGIGSTMMHTRMLCRIMINFSFVVTYSDQADIWSGDIWNEMMAHYKLNGVFVPY